MVRTKLLGFSGGMGVGKSTAIASLEEHLGHKVKLIKFAEELYIIQEFIYGRISSVIRREESFTKDRKLLQWLGTDWGRGIDPNLWVRVWVDKARKALDEGYYVVADDVRFDNEAQLVKSIGGKLVNITRPNAHSHAQGGVGIQNHASESGINPEYVDAFMPNDGTLEDYKRGLAALYDLLGISPVTE